MLQIPRYFLSFLSQVFCPHIQFRKSEMIWSLSCPASYMCCCSGLRSFASQNLLSSEPKRKERKRPDLQTRKITEVQEIWNSIGKILAFTLQLLLVYSSMWWSCVHSDHGEKNGPTVVWKSLSYSIDRRCSCYTFSPTEYRWNQ